MYGDPMCGRGGVARRRAGSHGLTEELRAAAGRWALASAKAQGLPERVSDGSAIRRVSVLLGCSDAPDGLEPFGVEAVEATPSRPNNNVVENRGDDRVLP